MTDNYDSSIIHYYKILCFDVPFDGTYGTLVRTSINIEEVTCSKCQYFYDNPKAREMERKFRIVNSINN